MRAVDLWKGRNEESGTYGNNRNKVLAQDGFDSSEERKNKFVLFSSGGSQSCRLGEGEVPLLFSICVEGSNDSQEYLSLQYVDVKRPVYIVDKMPGYVCVRWSADDEVNNSLTPVTGSLE